MNPQYDGRKVRTALKDKQHTQKHYYDRTARPLSSLNPGDEIRVRHENTWNPGIVESKADTPRSYVIRTDKGQKLRRNRRHLLKTTENRTTDQPETFYDCQEDIQNDRNYTSNNEFSNSVPQNETGKFTSGGREVKMPKRYEDYVMK